MIIITINGISKEIKEGTTLEELLNGIEELPKSGYATGVNHVIYPRHQRNECILREGDEVVVIRPFHGG